MTDKAVSALTSLTGANAATGDLLYIVDISEAAAADRSKKITAQELQNYIKGFPATIGVGGATPAASGAGVSFPATQSASSDANTLDDYEEGDWSSSLGLTIGGSATGITFSGRVARYTKVGRLVNLAAGFNLTSKGAGSGDVLITGLPFTVGDPGAYGDAAGSIGYYADTNLGTLTPFGIAVRGATTFRIFKAASGGSTSLNNSDLTNTSAFIFSVSYIV